MSSHLKIGDPKPAFNTESKFRLYSMLYCPYAQRPRLVLAAKNGTDFDTVNVQLRENIPEWYNAVNPLNKVPAVEFADGTAIYESLIIADYFDEIYPQSPLHPSDPLEKAQQRLFVEIFGNSFVPRFHTYAKERTDENKEALVSKLSECEQHLGSKKSAFFGGSEARMVDYMIWPFFERLPVVDYELTSELHPNLVSWCGKMRQLPAVKHCAITGDVYKKFYNSAFAGKTNYDVTA